MKLSGLSRQWLTRDGLFNAFVADSETMRFLDHLEQIDGPDLWVGSSHRTLNFCARDTRDHRDDVPPLAWVEARRSGYRVEHPCPIEFSPWPGAVFAEELRSVEEAAQRLLEAVRHSGNNPVRPGFEQLWFVCAGCDWHAPEHSAACRRCGHAFPPQIRCQIFGLHRQAHTPEGAVAPTKSGISWPP